MLEKRHQHIPQQSKPENKQTEASLRGTFASVMILGAVLAVSWIGAFLLFLART